jgi:hypothetical protein
MLIVLPAIDGRPLSCWRCRSSACCSSTAVSPPPTPT